MYKESTDSRKMRAIGMLLETTVSQQEISKVCMLSFEKVSELRRELTKLGCSFKHREVYKPSYRPSPKVNTELNMKAWRKESSNQEKRHTKSVSGGMRTKSNSIESMISKYR